MSGGSVGTVAARPSAPSGALAMPIAASFSAACGERDLEARPAASSPRERQRHPPRLLLLRVAVDRPRPPPRRRRARASIARRAPAGVRDAFGVDAALEAVRRLGVQAQPLGGPPDRRADRRSPSRAGPRSSSPRPRCRRRPSRPPARSRPCSSAITTSPSCSGRSTPSSVVMRSPRFARRTCDAAAQLVEIERVQRVAGLQHHVVGDVDEVRDRAHPAGRQPHAHRQRARARP